jgi:hypothetical protein
VRLNLYKLTIGAALLSLSCSDVPTEPTATDLELEMVGGDGQSGVPGWKLSEALVVRVRDEEGLPVSGINVTFEARGGGHTSSAREVTGDLGTAVSSWTLGENSALDQEVLVSLQDGSAQGVFRATSLSPEETDVLVVRGALGPLTGLVVSPPGSGLEADLVRHQSDTLFHLPELEAGASLVVFSSANRPLLSVPTWTSAIDTVVVELEPPVSIDLDIHVRTGTFSLQREIMLEQLENTELVWATEGVGVTLGEVAFEDDTDPIRTVNKLSAGICSNLTLKDAIQIDVVSTINSGQYTGWGCWAGQIFMANGTRNFPYLLAHELGHTFTLVHTFFGMMFPTPPGTSVNEGEIFRAHFHRWSSLNTIFAGQAEELRRDCSAQGVCFPESLNLGAGSASPLATAPFAVDDVIARGPVDADLEKGRN